MEKYSAKNLYLVKPSIVVYSKTKEEKTDLREFKTYYHQKVKLEQRTNDIDIVIIDDKGITNITSDNIIEQYDNTYEEGKRYIGITEKDKVLLVKYLCKVQFKNFVWTKGLENFFIQHKPEYTKEELIELIELIKEKNNKNVTKVKTLERKYSKQIPCGFHII
ncbi:MAG: hypothetical protein E7157_05515 [Lactobacillales bacterium]|nr:hypothetical protein [Lactobacillales bacterium]